jgi:hypothetical protein
MARRGLLAVICALAALALRASASEAAQRQALMDLFEATHGDQWLERGGWGSSTLDYCGWFGITCVRGNVTKLDLRSNNLAGPVPASIEKLTHLEDLRMASNILLVGPIPDGLVKLVPLSLEFVLSSYIVAVVVGRAAGTRPLLLSLH